MFHADLTFVLALIALTMGASLILSAKTHPEISTALCQLAGFTVIILAIITLFFSGYTLIAKTATTYRMQSQGMMMQQMPLLQPGHQGTMPHRVPAQSPVKHRQQKEMQQPMQMKQSEMQRHTMMPMNNQP
jgi:hypothetical protein